MNGAQPGARSGPPAATGRQGGAGGSFTGVGGAGGGQVSGLGPAGIAGDDDSSVSRRVSRWYRRGTRPGAFGPGGGAVYLIANTLVVNGTINASGGGGAGALTGMDGMDGGGGGGGGAGGFIGLDAPTVTVNAAGQIFANGGGGGEGGTPLKGSDNGDDPSAPGASRTVEPAVRIVAATAEPAAWALGVTARTVPRVVSAIATQPAAVAAVAQPG